MRSLNRRPDKLCPKEAKATALRLSAWTGAERVLDTHGDHLGWLVGGTTNLVVYDKTPFEGVRVLAREGRLKLLPESEGDVI